MQKSFVRFAPSNYNFDGVFFLLKNVDYKNKKIKVSAWRQGERVTKKTVLKAGLSGNLLAIKTSKHNVPDKPDEINVPLKKLK